MENKSNEATPLRPQGDRVIDAPLVEMDLNKFINQIRSEATWKESDHNSITIFKSDTMRIVLIGIHEKASLKTHSADTVISLQVLEGKVRFKADERVVSLGKGQMIALHSRIPHSVSADTESFVLLTLAALAK